jgi:signal transduction histidine kinase
VVYAHEGDIQVQSRPNQGTTFSLSFPYRYTQADRASKESNLASPDHN